MGGRQGSKARTASTDRPRQAKRDKRRLTSKATPVTRKIRSYVSRLGSRPRLPFPYLGGYPEIDQTDHDEGRAVPVRVCDEFRGPADGEDHASHEERVEPPTPRHHPRVPLWTNSVDQLDFVFVFFGHARNFGWRIPTRANERASAINRRGPGPALEIARRSLKDAAIRQPTPEPWH